MDTCSGSRPVSSRGLPIVNDPGGHHTSSINAVPSSPVTVQSRSRDGTSATRKPTTSLFVRHPSNSRAADRTCRASDM